MPHTRSARKSLRKSEKRRLHNRAIKKSIKTELKKIAQVAQTGSVEALREELRTAIRKLDKAAAKRVVHPNLAARKKSQLARLLNRKEHGGAGASSASK
jgi:small subunit ribosomal protein S20